MLVNVGVDAFGVFGDARFHCAFGLSDVDSVASVQVILYTAFLRNNQ